MNLSLVLAVFWLLVSLILFLWPVFHPGAKMPTLYGFSMGWLGLLMMLYNLLRWWSRRAFRAERRLLEEEGRRPQRPVNPPPAREPDPNFNFTEPTPPREGEEGRPPP
ncbi:MAG: hypothetical protein JO112_00625 [Planctomycetes bacterium]|nr:hypothetical protein [Planctomycetota bacterium]